MSSSSSVSLLLLVLVVFSATFLETVATSREWAGLGWRGCAELWWGEGRSSSRCGSGQVPTGMHAGDHRHTDWSDVVQCFQQGSEAARGRRRSRSPVVPGPAGTTGTWQGAVRTALLPLQPALRTLGELLLSPGKLLLLPGWLELISSGSPGPSLFYLFPA